MDRYLIISVDPSKSSTGVCSFSITQYPAYWEIDTPITYNTIKSTSKTLTALTNDITETVDITVNQLWRIVREQTTSFLERYGETVDQQNILLAVEHPIFSGSYSEGQFLVYQSILKLARQLRINLYAFSVPLVKKYPKAVASIFTSLKEQDIPTKTKAQIKAAWKLCSDTPHPQPEGANSDEIDAFSVGMIAAHAVTMLTPLESIAIRPQSPREHAVLQRFIDRRDSTLVGRSNPANAEAYGTVLPLKYKGHDHTKLANILKLVFHKSCYMTFDSKLYYPYGDAYRLALAAFCSQLPEQIKVAKESQRVVEAVQKLTENLRGDSKQNPRYLMFLDYLQSLSFYLTKDHLFISDSQNVKA